MRKVARLSKQGSASAHKLGAGMSESSFMFQQADMVMDEGTQMTVPSAVVESTKWRVVHVMTQFEFKRGEIGFNSDRGIMNSQMSFFSVDSSS